MASIFGIHRDPGNQPVETPPGGPASGPRPPAAAVPQGASLADLRTVILNRLTLAIGVISAVVYLIELPLNIGGQRWLVLIAVGLTVVGMFVAAFNRKMNYNLRAGLLLCGVLATSLATLSDDGLMGSGRIFLILLPILATTFTGLRGRIGWMIVSIGMLILAAIGMITGVIPAPVLEKGAGDTSLNSWLFAIFSFGLSAFAAVTSLGLLLEGLETSLRHQKALSSELEGERAQLELRIEASTSSLQRRLIQLRTVSEITGTISRVLDIDQLLPEVCELIRDRFNLYYVGIFLIEPGRSGDEADHYAVLRAGTGDAGREMLSAGHRLAVGGDSMIGWTCANKQARIALDVGADAVRFSNPYLPGTRSELALPINISSTSLENDTEKAAGEVRALGALTIQSTQEAAFDQDDITTLQGIASSLASAIENARLFSALSANLSEVRLLHRQYLEGAWSQMSDQSKTSYTFTPRENRRSAVDAAGIGPGAVLEVPIRLRDSVIGSLHLEADEGADGQAWSAEDRAMVEAVVNQAALALENARLLEETQWAAEIERRAAGISSKLWSTNDIESIVRTTLRELGAALEAREGWIELWPAGAAREAGHGSD